MCAEMTPLLQLPPRILHNRVRCTQCGDVIESVRVHDFRRCSCGACAVDGGRDYVRWVGELEMFEDLIEYAEGGEGGTYAK